MRIIKRNGSEEDFNIEKIINAVKKANGSGEHKFLTDEQIEDVADYVEYKCNKIRRAVSVEEIQDMVEDQLMAKGAFELARRYVRYRYNRSLVRKANTTDNRILSLIECNNEEVKQENSNKNPTVNSVQRDYMAGEVSRDLTRRMLLPADIVEADKEGIIHFHDSDYFAQHMHNCDLVNLEDMLQNGTVISDTLIERPHSFSTACNIATQIIAQVASNQYGGQSISLAHLAPFVQVSREKIRRETLAEIEELGVHPTEEKINDIVEQRLRKEVNRGVQTIQYQVVTLLTTNGQAPFVTVFMYLNEAKNEQEKHDLAMIIEETLKQRHKGVKNEKGVWITPAFPKLIYVLEEDNITEDSKYWYLTELAAKCTAKRMVPDYISEKVMLQSKIDKNGEGHCFTCMGCRSFLTPYVDENGKPKYYGRFNQGVVTVNLIDIGLSAGKDLDKFWKIFDERMELCHRALQCRHERLTGTLSDAAPILWQYLTELAAKCTAKRMVPDYISEKVMLQSKIDKNGEGHCFTCMGCRSFLTPYVDENGKPKYYGRFNQGVVTVNLIDIGLSAGKDLDKFWKIFDERMELCHRALQCRHERLTGTLSDAAPILWQYGALARLKKGEKIDKLLHGGYSTLSLGYAGLWECVYSLIGKKLTEKEGKELGLEIMQKLNDYCAKWKKEENIDYSIYGTPLESTTYKFAKCLQKRFGIIKGVTDKNYITNSYHVHVTENIDAFSKLKLESEFQALSPGGAISYVEVPNMQDNIPAVLQVIKFIYDNIMYAELNTKSDYCQVCGYDGEIKIVHDDGKLVWECPNCGNRDQDKMNVARRTCGYIGTQFWNQGRTQEIEERVLHL